MTDEARAEALALEAERSPLIELRAAAQEMRRHTQILLVTIAGVALGLAGLLAKGFQWL